MASPCAERGLLTCRCRDHHDAAIAHAALGDDVVGEMPDFPALALERRYLHAGVASRWTCRVASDRSWWPWKFCTSRSTDRAQRDRKHIPRLRRTGLTRLCPRRPAAARRGRIANHLGSVLITAGFRRGIDLREQFVFNGDGDPLHLEVRVGCWYDFLLQLLLG